MKILDLVLKGKWYDMIASGERREDQWCLYYKPKKHNEKSRIDDVPMYAPDLIECAVQMIIWLINYGYQLNGIEKGGSEHGED